jgi:hypothetical protein
MTNTLTAEQTEQIYKLETNRLTYILKHLDNTLEKKEFNKEKNTFIKVYNSLSEVFDCSQSLVSKMIIKEMDRASASKQYKRLFKLNSLLLIIND